MFDRIYGALRKAGADSLPANKYPKVLYDALDKDFTPQAGDAVFAHISHDITESRQQSMGTHARFGASGFLHVTLYDKTGDGDKVQLANASSISDYLRNRKVSGTGFYIVFESPTAVNSPRNGAHWVRQVRAPFRVVFYPSVN